MALPPPIASFTIPSINDGTELQCRIYHPKSSTTSTLPVHHRCRQPQQQQQQHRLHRAGAIIAHPYAPLGGSYDDPVVQTVAAEVLRAGFVVGTFNFRGAAAGTANRGRTSWTGRAEAGDYISFAGLMVHYLNELEMGDCRTAATTTALGPPLTTRTRTSCSADGSGTDGHEEGDMHPLTPIQSQAVAAAVPVHGADEINAGTENSVPVSLIIGGYSYGSMIATSLPPIADILLTFASPAEGTAASEIRLRAAHLARDRNAEVRTAAARYRQSLLSPTMSPMSPGSPKIRPSRSSSVTYGGDESEAYRASHEQQRPRRSGEGHWHHHLDKRKSFEVPRPRFRLRRNLSSGASSVSSSKRSSTLQIQQITSATSSGSEPAKPGLDMAPPKINHLLVSPLLPPLSGLLTMFSAHHSSKMAGGISREDAEARLCASPTLAVYGMEDGFTACRKARRWAEGLASRPGSRFQYKEIAGAGHFWHEAGVEKQLRAAVGHWLASLSLLP